MSPTGRGPRTQLPAPRDLSLMACGSSPAPELRSFLTVAIHISLIRTLSSAVGTSILPTSHINKCPRMCEI